MFIACISEFGTPVKIESSVLREREWREKKEKRIEMKKRVNKWMNLTTHHTHLKKKRFFFILCKSLLWLFYAHIHGFASLLRVLARRPLPFCGGKDAFWNGVRRKTDQGQLLVVVWPTRENSREKKKVCLYVGCIAFEVECSLWLWQQFVQLRWTGAQSLSNIRVGPFGWLFQESLKFRIILQNAG